jgi:tetratricopeptide (TPR) repeat protein
MLEAEGEGAARTPAAAIPSSALAVPSTLHASLMARLDRLGPAKEVAQIGAALGREFSYALLAAVVDKPEAVLQSALDRLVAAGLAFRQGVLPQASYLFKHALVQDAAYGTLLREPRRALPARIVEALETQFPEIAESQPELLARHSSQAGLIEKAVSLWAKAGQHSLERSALVEAIEQITRAIEQIATLPSSPTRRSEQIELQVMLLTPLIHVRGYAAPETKMAADQARALIEQAELLGDPVKDPLLLFSVLYGFWVHSYVALNGNMMCELAIDFLSLAEKQASTAALMVGHRLMGTSLMTTGDILGSLPHYNRAIALYDPAKHRSLAARFAVGPAVSSQCFRSWSLWLLGYPDAALASATDALKGAREIAQTPTLMYALFFVMLPHIWCGEKGHAKAHTDELVVLADEKGTAFWQADGIRAQGYLLASRLCPRPQEFSRRKPQSNTCANSGRDEGAGARIGGECMVGRRYAANPNQSGDFAGDHTRTVGKSKINTNRRRSVGRIVLQTYTNNC